MPTMRKRAKTQEPSSTPNSIISDDHTQSKKLSLYERSREERIKENLERMQKLGIAEITQKLRSSVPPKRTQPRKSAEKSTPILPTLPVRRSSRLQNVAPVTYSEVKLTKKDTLLEDRRIILEEGSKPEIYTEEHDKLLGNTEKVWELFVDGYGKDGRRIYDPIKGKTCHQCRQKTLGHRTNCSQCNMVQGQFCGDCLYMRYGEHVLEALQNPNWICPVCRGICNCSLCRQAKGWPPTGALYKRVSNLGYKSVAHYLIQTRRVQTKQETTLESPIYASAKRSLPFSEKETETVADESPSIIMGNGIGLLKPNLDLKMEQEENSVGHVSVTRCLPFSGKEPREFDENCGLLGPKFEPTIANGGKDLHEGHTDAGNSPKLLHKCNNGAEPTPDSIAGRLRLRRRMHSGDNGEPTELEKE